jgi:hypothetical protein
MPDWCSWLWKLFWVPDVRPPYNKDWEADLGWYMTVQPKDGVDYATLKEHADRKLSEMDAAQELAEKKAEWLFGLGFTASGAALFAVHSWSLSIWWSLLPLISLWLAMVWALRARVPSPQPVSVPIKGAIEILENDKSPQLRMFASKHCEAEAVKHAVQRKTSLLRRSATALIIAAFLFVAPVAFSAKTPAAGDQKPPTDQPSQANQSGTADGRPAPVPQAMRWEQRWELVPVSREVERK